MVENNKRKKHHDKDKYYRLAKEQGLRSRAAFKLVQINRKFHFLENAKVVLDLCAAPGGWTQIASRTMSRSTGKDGGSGNIIVAVDILPIRHIGSNVISLVGDITTQECHAKIKQTLSGASVDVVLCDGAPNVGANYDRDAYAQNEIALLSLKCATAHLRPNGTFVTKLYRSRDYNAYLWVVRQLFREIKAVKPVSSRAQSAEIFIVCVGYKAPDKLDPKLLDPKAVFEQLDEEEAGAGGKPSKKVTIFHKSYDTQSKGRKRQGYDLTNLDATMRNIGTVGEFINSPDPIQMLTDYTGLTFCCGTTCSVKPTKDETQDNKGEESGQCPCMAYLNHRLTTTDIKECVADLKVLGKGDFKSLLNWRLKMQEVRDELVKRKAGKAAAADQEGSDDDGEEGSDDEKRGSDSDDEEKIQQEIKQLHEQRLREKKREKKKDRESAAKRRRRAALGMDLNAIDVPEHEQIFSLATITSKGDLEAVREVDLDKIDKKLMVGEDDDDDAAIDEFGEPITRVSDVHYDEYEDQIDEDTGYSYRLDSEMDMAYDMYLAKTKNKAAKAGTRMAKREKISKKKQMSREAAEDEEILITAEMDDDTKRYAKLLQGEKDSDDEVSGDEGNSDEDDDGFHAEPVTPEVHARVQDKKKDKAKESNPLIYEPPEPEEPVSAKTARWFSNPLFESVGIAAHTASLSGGKKRRLEEADESSDDDDGVSDAEMSFGSDDEKEATKRVGLDSESILANWPKTDKQMRHEKRMKALARKERKEAKRTKLDGEGFEVVAGQQDHSKWEDDVKLADMTEGQRKKALQARALIKAGMGAPLIEENTKSLTGFDVVPSAVMDFPVMDTRKYDSEHEDYDSDDQARTLALGTMMLRKSKAKALVDASYNRYAWNDPEDLPDWFVDNEQRHHRPQLPIPADLVEKMKARFVALSTKPIKKVAEARARKSKRAKLKLSAAKKKAEAVANNPDMSETMKLKAISKAMRGQENSRPGKTYVVAKKGVTKGGKGVKLVDKRIKSDKRSMERSTKKKKHGKKGGLTGSKRRRNHK